MEINNQSSLRNSNGFMLSFRNPSVQYDSSSGKQQTKRREISSCVARKPREKLTHVALNVLKRNRRSSPLPSSVRCQRPPRSGVVRSLASCVTWATSELAEQRTVGVVDGSDGLDDMVLEEPNAIRDGWMQGLPMSRRVRVNAAALTVRCMFVTL